jgi:hypothetical protein
MGTTGASPSPPPSRLAYLAGPFVWLVWAVLFLALLGFVAALGRDVPFADDWDVLPWVSGQRPVELSWLWQHHNEHRIPLPKLIWVVLGRLTGCDMRAGMYFNSVALGTVSAGLIVAARRLRGRTAFTDAYFPLALLHWGQHQNLLWSFEVQFIGSAVLALIVLVGVAIVPGRPTTGQGLLIGGCLVVLPLWGANGLLLVPPLALWLAAAGAARWRSGLPHARRDGALWLGLAGAALSLVAASFVGEKGVGAHPPSPDTTATVQTAYQFFVMAVGPGGETALPYSILPLVLLVMLCALPLVAGLRDRPGERWRNAGLLCYLVALVGLGLAIGWGRAGFGGVTAQYSSRFVTLATPLLCWCYFVALVVPARSAGLRAVPWVLFAVMLALLWLNTSEGLDHGKGQARGLSRMQADISGGMTPDEVARHWQPIVYYSTGPKDPVKDRARRMQECLEWLRETGQGPYRGRPRD